MKLQVKNVGDSPAYLWVNTGETLVLMAGQEMHVETSVLLGHSHHSPRELVEATVRVVSGER